MTTTSLARIAAFVFAAFAVTACRGRSSPAGTTGAVGAAGGSAATPAASTATSKRPTPTLFGLPPAGSSSAVDLPPNVPHGRELYGRMCAVCHGANGEGYRADAAPALSQPDFLATVTDEFLDFAIAIGRARTPMSAWRTDQGGPLSAWDIKSVIAFMRTWPASKVTIDESYVHGDIARGKATFASKCDGCHGTKGTSEHILNRQWLTYARPPFMRYAIAHGRPPTPMPAFADSLGADGIEEVLGYLRSLPSWLVPGEVAGSVKPPPIPLGPVPLNADGPAPVGFRSYPAMTSMRVIWHELKRHARIGILDARTSSDYTKLHIEGAVSVPFYDPTPYIDALPKNAWLICYCGCPHSESGALAQQLINAGFTKVAVLDEGFGAWTTAEHPTRSGSTP